MSDEKQKTPKGAEIPVPKKRDFMRDLKKIAKGVDPKKVNGTGSATSSSAKK